MKYKRIALALSPENDKVLTELANLTSNCKTTIVNSLVIEAMPAFRLAVAALNKVKEGQQDMAVNAIIELVKDISGDMNEATLELAKMGVSNDRKK